MPRYSIEKVLHKYRIPKIKLEKSINSKTSIDLLKELKPDLLISIAGNEIFKKPLIELAPRGCLNLHTALLPKNRGLMPSFWALKNNEKYTGVSVFFVDEGIDSGPILVQKKVEVGNRTLEELIIYTKKLGMKAILEAIQVIQTADYELVPNQDEESTYNTFPTAEDVRIFRQRGKKFY